MAWRLQRIRIGNPTACTRVSAFLGARSRPRKPSETGARGDRNAGREPAKGSLITTGHQKTRWTQSKRSWTQEGQATCSSGAPRRTNAGIRLRNQPSGSIPVALGFLGKQSASPPLQGKARRRVIACSIARSRHAAMGGGRRAMRPKIQVRLVYSACRIAPSALVRHIKHLTPAGAFVMTGLQIVIGRRSSGFGFRSGSRSSPGAAGVVGAGCCPSAGV